MLSLKSILCLIAMCGGVAAHEANSHRLKSESATYDGRRGLEDIDWKEFMAQLHDYKSPNQTPSPKPTSRTGSWGDIVTRYPTKSPTGESIESQKQTGQITRFPTIPPTPRPTPSPSMMPSTEPSFSPHYALPIDKELADALTDDVRVQAKGNDHLLRQDGTSEHNKNEDDIVLSKRRQKRVKQLLRGNSPPLFRHLCKESNACFKYLI